jgi:60 kDa SS-A/Ro ribonucleoprotein
MSSNLAAHISKRPKGPTPATKRARADEVKNAAGGYVFPIDKWTALDRFLILGTDGGTYYVSERKLTRANAKVVDACLLEDAGRVVKTIAEISDSGRAPKNSAALLALAIASSHSVENIRHMALVALPKVARIPTHLFEFITYAEELRGWGPTLRGAVGKWYNRYEDADSLAYHMVKYQSRNDWSNRDVLRLAHPKPKNQEFGDVFKWITKGIDKIPDWPVLPGIIQAFELLKGEKDPAKIAEAVRTHNLTREMIPTEGLKSPVVWEALLEKMPLMAMIRSLGPMSANNFLVSGSDAGKEVRKKLEDTEALKKQRVHPISILVALKTYAQGHGEKGKLTWKPVQSVVNSLDEAFYSAYGAVQPTGKRVMLALDTSGSMQSPANGVPLSCREASAAMALVTLNVEDDPIMIGFTDHVQDLDRLNGKMRLDDAVKYLNTFPANGTNCSLPWAHARMAREKVDAIVEYTDNETWMSGQGHVFQAVGRYRNEMHKPACRSIVVAASATQTSINDPKDPFGLDVAGFDTSVPEVISQFIRGE